jgi:hypothetical protein
VVGADGPETEASRVPKERFFSLSIGALHLPNYSYLKLSLDSVFFLQIVTLNPMDLGFLFGYAVLLISEKMRKAI